MVRHAAAMIVLEVCTAAVPATALLLVCRCARKGCNVCCRRLCIALSLFVATVVEISHCRKLGTRRQQLQQQQVPSDGNVRDLVQQTHKYMVST